MQRTPTDATYRCRDCGAHFKPTVKSCPCCGDAKIEPGRDVCTNCGTTLRNGRTQICPTCGSDDVEPISA